MADEGIVVAEETGVACNDYGKHAGAGFEGQTTEDVQIPFLLLLQDLSPQCKEIEGAKPGLLFNSVTEEVYTPPVTFIPCYRERVFVEWRKRDLGGGFISRHAEDSELVLAAKAASPGQFGPLEHPENPNHQLVNTVYMYGLLIHEDRPAEFCVIAFTSTKMAAYRKWNTQAKMVTVGDEVKQRPPLYAHQIALKTVIQTNSANQKFYNFLLDSTEKTFKASLLSANDARFMAAVKLREMITSGVAKAAEEVAEPVDDGGGAF